VLQAGGRLEQETLHFDPASGRLSTLRSKEEAQDYRYFPEPDLVPLVVSREMIERARAELPELPAARAERFERELGLNSGIARDLAFHGELGDYYERALGDARAADGRDWETNAQAVELANWIPQLVARLGADADLAESKVAPAALAGLAAMVRAKEVSRDAAREVLSKLVEEGGDPRAIVERDRLGALGAADDGLSELVDRALAFDPDAAEKLRAGNMKAIGPLVGYVMRETNGRADGGQVTRLIRERVGQRSDR
jgi:aspartyl-tRNA(Asn)/glutamyl-tRNA(Gln) amidotransferase subunit B